MRVQSETVQAAVGESAEFALEALGVDACPARWRPTSRLSLLPCADVLVGSMAGTGHSPAMETLTGHRFWGSAGASARVEVELASWVVAELQGGLGVPWTRHEFYFAPSDVVYRMPYVGGSVAAGLGVRFP